MPRIAEAGAGLVAVGLQKPDDSVSIAARNHLSMEVLWDQDGIVSKKIQSDLRFT